MCHRCLDQRKSNLDTIPNDAKINSNSIQHQTTLNSKSLTIKPKRIQQPIQHQSQVHPKSLNPKTGLLPTSHTNHIRADSTSFPNRPSINPKLSNAPHERNPKQKSGQQQLDPNQENIHQQPIQQPSNIHPNSNK